MYGNKDDIYLHNKLLESFNGLFVCFATHLFALQVC